MTIPHSHWIAGFTSGDGCFTVLIRPFITKDPKDEQQDKFRIVLRFVISQHKKDQLLMTNIIRYLHCGRWVEYDNMRDLIVENNRDNIEKIIPFFSENKILGVKAKNLEDWVKIANIINSKGYVLNKQDVETVYKIKSGMNNGVI